MASSSTKSDGDTVTVRSVADWLRERIRRGRLVPGQRLIEADVTRETGASRGRVREAFQRLESEGLIVIEEFRGASVRSFSPDEMRQIYRTRMALEGMAAHDFAAFGPAEDKAALGQLQEQLNGCEHTGDHDLFARLNDAWHRAILKGARNDHLEAFVERLRVPIYRLLFTTFYSAQRIDSANAGHREITAAIVAGDAATAEALMRAHIAEGLDALSQIERDLS